VAHKDSIKSKVADIAVESKIWNKSENEVIEYYRLVLTIQVGGKDKTLEFKLPSFQLDWLELADEITE